MVSKSRSEAIMRAVQETQADLLPGDEAMVTICSGPPLCNLKADEATDRMRHGCALCQRMMIGEELART